MINPKVSIDGLLSLLVRRYTGPFWARRRELARTQWLSQSELEQLQLCLLRRQIGHCYHHIPFYRRIMDEKGIRLDQIQSLKDIERFPILTKKDVLKAGTDLHSKKSGALFVRTAYTGGTTGTPVMIKRNLLSIGTEHAFVRRQFDWAGISMADRTAYLTGRIVVPPDQVEGKLFAFDPFMRELILSTYHLSEDSGRQYLAAMQQYRVKALVGYPSAISFLAGVSLVCDIKLPLKAVLTSSETLGESMKRQIQTAFQCPVYDYYGSAERVCYVFTCEQGCYHIQSEYGLTELIPVEGENTFKVVSTGFWNKAMPFIRYDMGDTVVVTGRTCSCGRAFPVIDSICGRQADVIRTPSGRTLGTAMLTHLLYGTDHILESQIIQDALDHVYIDYVPGENFSSSDYEAFLGLVKQHLPSELKVEFRQVTALPKTASGKVRSVISMIDF